MKIKTNKKAKKNTDNLIDEILYSRGMLDMKEELLAEDVPLDFPTMPDEEKFTAEVLKSIKAGETIAIYTDTDVDGIMSGVIMKKALDRLGGKSFIYTNNKLTDGYGMCNAGLEKIFAKHPDTKLIITCDNGITADTSLAYEKGARVIISDHHEPKEVLPRAEAIVDCKRTDVPCEYKDLCGAGVVYHLVELLYIEENIIEEELLPLLEYVTIATVADVVPLLKLNRNIVKTTLSCINESIKDKSPVCSMALTMMRKKFGIAYFDTGNIGFSIAPLINALGRIKGDVTRAFTLFLTNDEFEAQQIVCELDSLNEERKAETSEQTELAEQLLADEIKEEGVLPFLIMLKSDRFAGGIAGIVAGKIKESYNRPCIILCDDGSGILSGSARSTDTVHITNLLTEESSLLEGFGGHSGAAGLSLKAENFETLKANLEKRLQEKFTEEDFEKVINVDAVLENVEMTHETMHEIDKLAPFGKGFEEPLFYAEFIPKKVEPLGADFSHLKVTDLETGTAIIKWGGGHLLQTQKDFTQAVGHLRRNIFGRNCYIQFIADEIGENLLTE